MTEFGSDLPRRLLTALAQQRSATVELLERVVAIESPSEDPTAIATVQEVLAAELAAIGYRVRLLSGCDCGDQLLAYPGDREREAPLQLLLGHCDTVWPVGTLRDMPLRVSSGRMMGPGVYDMKGGLVQALVALRALRVLNERPSVTPVLFINSDEETGSGESTHNIARLSRLADRVLVLEPAMGTSGMLKTARKGVGRFTIDVFGRAAHAGLEPGKGVSAILEMSYVVQKIAALDGLDDGVSVNVGTVTGGLRPNVVAPSCRAEIDFRILRMDQARRIEREIRSLRPTTAGARIEIRGGLNSPPLERTPRNRALWELARGTGRRLGLELEECQVGGGSDGNTASQYAPTLDGLGPIGDGAHASHEFIEIDSLIERGALLALLLLAPPLSAAGGQESEAQHALSGETVSALS